MSVSRIRRLAFPLLLAYPPLALLGAGSHRQGCYTAALIALLAGLALLLLDRRRWLASVLWLALALAACGAILAGRPLLVLDLVPVLANVALAWLFGHTLCAGQQPLVARIIGVLEGEARLQVAGVAHYARQVTWFWTLLESAQAALATCLLVCAVPGGLLAALGWRSPLPLPQAWAAWYMHLGSWLLPVLAMLLEYGFRRWHMRHVPQDGLHRFILRLVTCWPRLVRSIVGPSS